MRRSRKPLWAVYVHRGFESLPLRGGAPRFSALDRAFESGSIRPAASVGRAVEGDGHRGTTEEGRRRVGAVYSVCESTCLPARRRTIEIPAKHLTGGARRPRPARRLPARRHPVLLGDLIEDPDVQVRARAAPARDKTAQALRPEHPFLGVREVADVVVGDELVDELEAPLVEDRLDEDPDLLLVVLTAARHREDHDRECGRAPTGRIPQRFPPCFRPERKRADRVVRCQARGQRPCSNASARRRRCARPSPARRPAKGP